MKKERLDFICEHCGKKVYQNNLLGNHERNHCPYCLWSKHEDLKESGDRLSDCHGLMEPIGLTFKKGKHNKYGLDKIGEILLIHKCTKCGKINLNHLAADDNENEILNVFEKSLLMQKDLREELEKLGIKVLTEEDRKEIERQLFGIS
ncbi:MAG: RNHCP domain-containing protein [Minisyncoccia bacterium]|jgi:DNA-directed RNA polymerase subunit RPC12/RpoP